MLFYGDHKESAVAGDRLKRLSEQLARVASMPPGLARHADLVGALVDGGQVQQGIEDAGCGSLELSDFVHALAAAVVHSWDTRFAELIALPAAPNIAIDGPIELRLPEGFAFYAVYPEQFIAAARRLKLNGRPSVIGIRSIGTTLAAVVAAALGAPSPATVRPFGDPFARQVELPLEVLDERAHYVIVDEGPGLSGSSFGAVADWLEARGVPLDRIAFLPSHGGDPGPKASAAHRSRWHRAQRAAAQFDPAFLRDVAGPLEPLASGGPWAGRKFLATINGEPALLKFAGLGAVGERKLAMARALHAAGYTPEPIGLVHGFLAERWLGDARPLASDDRPVEEIGRYIGARSRLFPAAEATGATIDELLVMCRRNIELALGEHAARSIEHCDTRHLASAIRRVRTDNKMDRDEWLRGRSGRLIKTDALDHHQAHDLIGCQGPAWDVAGAIAEFDLDGEESRLLLAATALDIDPALLDFYRIAYAAFRLGGAVLSGEMAGAGTAAGGQCRAAADRYRARLVHLLEQGSSRADSARILV